MWQRGSSWPTVTATQLYKVFMGGQAPMIPILPIRPDSSFYVAIYIGC